MIFVRVGEGPIQLLTENALCSFTHSWPRVRWSGYPNRLCCRIEGSKLIFYGRSERREWSFQPNSAVLVFGSGEIRPLDLDDFELPKNCGVFRNCRVKVGEDKPEKLSWPPPLIQQRLSG